MEQEQCQQQLNGASWDRFADRLAFSDDTVASVARQLQRCINQILYEDSELEMEPVTDNNEVELQGYMPPRWCGKHPLSRCTSTTRNPKQPT